MKAVRQEDSRITRLIHGSNSVESSDDGFVTRIRNHRLKKKEKEKHKNDIMVAEEIDPYSGTFNLNKIINGQLPYKKDEYYDQKFKSPRSQKKASGNHLNKSSSSIPVPNNKSIMKSMWPDYKSWSASSSTQSSPETEYESYSCDDIDCDKARVEPVNLRQEIIVDHCERETLQRFRNEVPLEKRGFVPDIFAEKVERIPDLTWSPRTLHWRTWESDSPYTYSYSSCSRDECERCRYVQILADGTPRNGSKKDIIHRPRVIMERDIKHTSHSKTGISLSDFNNSCVKSKTRSDTGIGVSEIVSSSRDKPKESRSSVTDVKVSVDEEVDIISTGSSEKGRASSVIEGVVITDDGVKDGDFVLEDGLVIGDGVTAVLLRDESTKEIDIEKNDDVVPIKNFTKIPSNSIKNSSHSPQASGSLPKAHSNSSKGSNKRSDNKSSSRKSSKSVLTPKDLEASGSHRMLPGNIGGGQKKTIIL